MYSQELEELSPFELNFYLEKHIKTKSKPAKEMLNVGRGNPNWTAAVPREAFFLLGQFATKETLASEADEVAGMIVKKPQLKERFLTFLNESSGKGADFLKEICYQETVLQTNFEDWLVQMMDYIIGDNYPHPVKVLAGCETVIKNYLTHELFADSNIPYEIFATEGGTAGICYLFATLVNNHLLNPGEKIALMLPMFAPYLEIPQLDKYHFDVVPVYAKETYINGDMSYTFPEEELAKLKDTSIKGLFVVNPSNPTANALSQETMEALVKIVKEDHPKLMILTDDVYGTFAPNFESLFTKLPYNTTCIYSYSKYFGATGWRIGTIAVAKENLFDELLQELPPKIKQELHHRYHTMDPDTDHLSFMDRIVGDSRDVALNHAAGLSGPQQVMMTLFSLYALLDTKDQYKQEVKNICKKRQHILFHTLGLKKIYSSLDTAYYCEINLIQWIQEHYGAEFTQYMTENWTLTKFLNRLAEKEDLMLLKADAFGCDKWAVRVSLANLATSKYQEVGERLMRLMKEIYQQYETQKTIA